MSGNKVIIDTNIAIYFLLGHKEVDQYFYHFTPIFSFISELELLSGRDFYPNELEEIKRFLSKQTIWGYSPALKEIVIEIRQKKKLKLPDAIIAATAVYFDIPLATTDKSFKNIDGLTVLYNEFPTL
ncbi:MAG: type II toxin-antitoxin system VapC family toxin [Sphingobacteriales bacterium]